jgi:hypothetical protein
LIIDGSTGVTVVGNTIIDGVPLVDIDHSSRAGSHIDDAPR